MVNKKNRFKNLALVAVLIITYLAINQVDANSPGENIIMEHGKYSQEYLSNWGALPTGKESIQANLEKDIKAALGLENGSSFNLKTKAGFQSVKAEDITVSNTWKIGDNQEIHLNNLAYKVKWNSAPYHGVLFYFNGYKKVVIENVAIAQEDADYRTYNTILTRDCDEVIVRNVYLAGSVGHAHLRIEGAKKVTIENVEVAGIDYTGQGKFRTGAGINILNGDPGYPMTPKLEWLTIQNCYFHDLNDGDGVWKNHDAILLESPADGIIFNCYFENWSSVYGDAAIDVGHRNTDVAYASNHFFRIERNVIDNCSYTKSPGGAGGNILFWANNLYKNAIHDDYHSGSSEYFINNTYIFSASSPMGFYQLDNFQGPTYSKNNLIYLPDKQFSYFINQNAAGALDKWKGYHSDYNVFAMGFYPHDKWVAGDSDLYTWESWKAAGNEQHSIMDIKETEGNNLLVNTSGGNSGEFTDWNDSGPTGWTSFGVDAQNYVAQEAGKCRMVNADKSLGIKQSNILTIGKLYKYSINIVDVKSGGIRFGSNEALATFYKAGARTGYFTAYEKDFVIKRDANQTDITFDDISIKEVSLGSSGTNNYFRDSSKDDYRLLDNAPAKAAGSSEYITPSDARMKITQDFYGVNRGAKPSVGAFESYVEVINQSPQTDAGVNQTTALSSQISLVGTVTDDGLPNPPGKVTVGWNKVSGPGTVTFDNILSRETKATFSATGIYVLRLTVSDGTLSGSDEVTVTVNPDPVSVSVPVSSAPAATSTPVVTVATSTTFQISVSSVPSIASSTQSSLPYSNGSILKSVDSDKIYLIANNKRRWLVNPEVFLSYGLKPNSEVVVSKGELNQYIEGPALTSLSLPEGTLVKAQNDYKVYIIKPPYKRHIFNPAIFKMYSHFNWLSIKEISQDELDAYITSDLYQATDDYRVYSLEEISEALGKAIKHHFNMTPQRFGELGYRWDQIFKVNTQERDYYETGAEIK